MRKTAYETKSGVHSEIAPIAVVQSTAAIAGHFK
jgi:hypothetical protein